MKIEINIIAPGLESAINNLATAIAGQGKITTTVTQKVGNLEHTETTSEPAPGTAPCVSATGQQLGEAKTTADDFPNGKGQLGMTAAQKQKAEISKEIIALGGTPPESGTIKKFQTVLDELKAPAEEAPAEEAPAEEAPAEEAPAEEAPAEEAPAEGPTLEEARMLAGYVVKNQTGDDKACALGKTKVRACLKKVDAESITALFETSPEKAAEFVKLLEGNAGKTLSEVVAETTAE